MNALILVCALVGAEPVDETQQKREWLSAHLIVNANFDADQIKDLQRKLDRMTPSQVNVLVEVYKMRWAQKQQAIQEQREYREQMLLGQAKLNLERAKAYRNHLAREYQYKILTENRLLEFMKQSRYMVLGSMYGRYGHNYGYRGGNYGNRRRGYYRAY